MPGKITEAQPRRRQYIRLMRVLHFLVAGALIALQDGLLVASSLPQELKTEMIAAFVPQIFGRLNQYSKELGLGETSATGFTIDSGIFQIYNAGIIYFAALGRKGESLPVHDLQLIAAELSRYTK